jgi:hypothetical protein
MFCLYSSVNKNKIYVLYTILTHILRLEVLFAISVRPEKSVLDAEILED